MTSNPTAVTLSREEFTRNLSDSGLFSADEIQKALAGVPTGGTADGAALGRQLVSAGKLTTYQAEAVAQRRFGELRFGNYEVLDRLGAGGMGTVFKARHRRMKRIVALKVLSRELAKSDTFVQRFQREVETIAQLSHPNIVMAFDADEAEVGHFLVMEFVNGHDLAREVQNNGPLPVGLAVDSVLQAARGLEYAHGLGIIHRDIKPANLLRDASGVVKVADLGLARLQHSESAGINTGLTAAGGIVGTLDFMPPEQAFDATSIDHRADIYPLGGTLFFLLTARPPYSAPSVMALLLKHSTSPVPSLCEARPGVPAEIDAVLQRMMAKKPEDRYQTMSEVVRALEKVAPIAASADASPVPLQHFPGAGDTDLTGATVAVPSAKMLPHSPPNQADPATTLAARGMSDLTVVLVEPSRTQAGIIRNYLQQLGISKVHSTGSGEQALALVKQTHANVVICSLHLSDMTGVELGHLLRRDESSAVGIVLTSSEAGTHEADALLQTPRTVLMPKPFDLARLAESLVQATGR